MTASALSDAVKVYQLDSATDRLLVRRNAIPMILATRQFAAILGRDTMGIAMPDGRNDDHDEFVFVGERGLGESTRQVDASALRRALVDRFGVRLIDSGAVPPSS
jgi:hypothetical protein